MRRNFIIGMCCRHRLMLGRLLFRFISISFIEKKEEEGEEKNQFPSSTKK